MFIDRLLESIIKQNINHKFEGVIEDLKKSQHFIVDNVAQYWFLSYQKYWNIEKDFPNITPQFSEMWFEFSIPNEMRLTETNMELTNIDSDVSKTGILLTSHEVQHNEITQKVRWECHALWFRETKDGNKIMMPVEYVWYVNTDGTVYLPNDHIILAVDNRNSTEYNQLLAEHCMSVLSIPLLTISFMHCKNVITYSNKLSVKLQKSRERKSKLPLVDFKTLEIKPMVKILKEEGESETKGLKHALHICRGHFKDFSQGPGLGRGHAHGLYWWDSQVRGSKDVGAVIKDYKVSPDDKSLKR